MAKNHSTYECQSCGQSYSRWEGRCHTCNEWNTIVEAVDEVINIKRKVKPSSVVSLESIDVSLTPRMTTGSKELDRVLGGGIVRGASVLIGGEPGIGKSTLLLELADRVCSNKNKVLYVTGEESLEQIKLRAERLNVGSDNLLIAADTSLFKVLSAIQEVSPSIIVVDSIQAIYDDELKSPMGSFSQLRQTVAGIIELAKSKNISTFLIGHVTKDGMIAGPKLIEHMVDAVIYFEGEENVNYRVLRTVKNRFGPSNEIGLFEMKSDGLSDVDNPSSFFLSGRDTTHPGSVIGSIITGTRPILLEIQSLLSTSYISMPRRTVVGYEANRVAMLLAVMEKYFHYSFSNLDMFVNVVGGLKTQEPALDLAVVVSIASSYLNKKPKNDFVLIGEVGLNGEVRKIPRISERINEAYRIGFKSAIVPVQDYPEKGSGNLIKVKNIKEVLDVVFE
ncbi:MAG: DNA repair protein RadA [Pseudomonadota bacterium]